MKEEHTNPSPINPTKFGMNGGIALVFLSTFLTAAGQVLWKIGSKTLMISVISFFTNIPILLGILCYVIAVVLLILALTKEELSIVYPIYSASYIWVLLASAYLLKEEIHLLNSIGILLILLGIGLLAKGSKKQTNKKLARDSNKEINKEAAQ